MGVILAVSKVRRQDRRRVVLVAVLAGGVLVAGCSTAKLHQHLSDVADRIHARDGQVVSDGMDGDGVDGRSLDIVTIRPGSPGDVAEAQAKAAQAIGYTDKTGSCEMGGCMFNRVPNLDLPFLDITTYPAGKAIPGTTVVVPEGDTAVVVSLGDG